LPVTSDRRHGVDLVIKIGGSLWSSRSLPRILGRIAWLARRRRLVVVPGGGPFAEKVRAAQRRFRFDDATAHRMALRAMDQYGLILAALTPRGRPVEDLTEARRTAAGGGVPILLAASDLDDDRTLEWSFRLGSDAIAAVVAARIGARRLVLLKSCACPRGPIESRNALRLLARRGVVDPLLPRLAPPGCEVRLFNARSAVRWDVALVSPETLRPSRLRAGLRGTRRDAARRAARRVRPGKPRRGPR